MKKPYSQIFKFALLLLVTNVVLGNSSLYSNNSITSSFSTTYDLNFDYKRNFQPLNLSSFIASQASFSKPLVKDMRVIKLIRNNSENRGVADCPGNLGPYSADIGTCDTVVNYTPPTSDVLVGGTMELMTALGTGDTFPVGMTSVIYEEYISGVPNGNICTFQVTVVDDEDPTASNPADITVQCLSDVPTADITVVNDEADNCGTPAVIHVGDSANPAINDGTIIRTYSVDDGNGNTIEITQNIIIDDTTNPATPTLADINIGQCSGTPATPTTTDACSGTITGTTSTTFPITTQGTTIVTWNFDDGNGNSISVDQNVIVDDTTNPITPTLADVNFGQCSGTPPIPTTPDVCSGTITGTTATTFPVTSQGTTVVTWNFDDGNGNSINVNQNVIVDDTTNPITPTLADVNVGQCSGTPPTPTTTDVCSGTITGTTATTFPVTSQGTTAITWNFDDGNGNAINVNQNVIVDDTTNPIIPTLANVNVGQCSGTPPTPTTTDACMGTITGTTATTFPITTQGTTVVTWNFDDGNGNTINVNQNVILEDTTAPVPNVTNLPTITGQCSATVTAPTATDNCRGQITGSTTNPTSYTSQGTYIINWIYNDNNGNISTQTQTITIEDQVAPVANILNLPTIIGQCSASVTAPKATDNCRGQITGTTTDPTSYNTQGTYIITWTYNDNNGNITTQTQTVNVEDTVAPVPNVTNLTTIARQCSATVTAPKATDNCRGQITGTTTDPTSYTAQGTYTITWTYNDNNGNISTQTQTVTVADTVAPVPNVTNLTTISRQCSATVNAPKATDNCKGQITGTTTDPTNYTTQGTYIITWTYNDTNGNISTQTQTVTVEDTIAPVANVTNLPNISGQCSATVTPPKATDNCKGQITATTTDPTNYTTQGNYIITWTYNDNNGNTSTQTQSVTVDDTIAPIANVTNLPTITAQCSATVTVPKATDNCSVQINGTTTNPTSYTTQGTFFITWSYNDNNGNTSTQSQTVIVDDTQFPTTPILPDLVGECSLTVTPPTTTDNCIAIITGTTGLSSLTFDTVGSDIIYWDFTDAAGNSILVTQNITITDSAPVPDLSVLNAQVFDGCQISNIIFLEAPTATDACDGGIVGTLSPNFVFPYSFSGTQTIDWEFIDSNSNVTIQSQDITLNPLPVVGGTINGTFQSTVFSDGIDISSCSVAISIALNLTDETGTIVRWEKYAVNDGVWEIISDTDDSYTASFAIGALESTYYRVLIQIGTCIEYSNQFLVRALPVGSAPTITNLDPDAIYCLGDEVSLLATSNYTAIQESIPDSSGDFNQGQLNTQDPDGWLVDGDPGGFTAGGSATKPRNWSAKTCNNQPNGSIVYCSNEGKYSIAYGDYSSNQYKGAIPTTFETPILDLSNAQTASLDFDQAYYFSINDYAHIGISTNGGSTYSTLRLMHAPGTPAVNWYTAGTAQSVVGSNATNYNFETDNTSIDLSAYLGQSNIRIKWSFTGTTNQSAWALDNIFVDKRVIVDTELEWTDGIGDPDEPPIADGATEVPFVFIPDAPGHHQYGTTALVNNCRTYEEDGTSLIDIYVSHSYAGENFEYLSQDCGQDTVQLNAYDNRITARDNATKGAFTLPANCLNCDDEGTGEDGVWSIAANSACGSGSFSNINDPNALFTADAGTYTLTWTVAGCESYITVKTINCIQIDFDGTNDYVDFGNNNFHFNSGAFTIEAWVKPEEISGTQTIISKRNGGGNNSGYELSVTGSGIVSFKFNQSGTISSSPYIINTNRWFHIALTYKSGRYTLYIDGVLIKSNTGSAPSLNTYRAILGAVDRNSNNGPTKYFNGWIDEFRVWNVGLTSDQLHQMMNQKIISSPTVAGNVQGETIPVDISGLLWSNLSAYFQMEPAQLACGYLESSSSNIKGKLKNIGSNQNQTAPIPYTSAVDGQWDADNTWTYPDVWDAPNSLGIDGTTRIDWNIVRTNHNIISSSRDLTLLGLLVNNNKLTITGLGTQDETNSGTGLWVTHYLKLLGNIDLVGESQLVQKRYTPSQFSDSFLDAASSGYLERDQQGTADKFTYNYWSSPVGVSNTTSNNNSYRVKDVMKDGINNINWITSGYNGTNTNPIGLADYWVWKYANLQNNSYSLWQHIRSTGTLKAGEGFTLKGPGSGPVAGQQNYVFNGKPNNGNINLTINSNNEYLVGNPYPSALDGRQFILDNGNIIAGNGATTGTLYFWEHWGGGSHVLAQYQGGYATYNLSGGTPSASYGTNDPNVGTGGTPTKIPGRYIPVSQGFFVAAEGSGGTIKFNNGQRIFQREGSSNSVFVRSSEVTNTTDYNPDGEDLRMKFRIGFNSVNTIHRQLLLTVDELATAGVDWGYDAQYIDDQMDDMYWMMNGEKYTIQGIDQIEQSSIVPLGLHLRNGGQNAISIDYLENVPDNVEIYLHDKVLDFYHDLRQAAYSFNLPSGTYLDRYELTFRTGAALGVDENQLTQLEMYYANDHENLILLNPELKGLKSIEMFNLLGQSVFYINNIENSPYSEFKIKNLSIGTYIVKLITETGSVSKKVLVK